MALSDDDKLILQRLEEDIERWTAVVSQMKADSRERRVVEAKLADWMQRRNQIAALVVAKIKHDRKHNAGR